MPHSHHSHSGSFCQHADPKSPLSTMIATALSAGFTTFCLTEHVPRALVDDLYPEEIASQTTPTRLAEVFEEYVDSAQTFVAQYQTQNPEIEILLGFEADWLRPEADTALIKGLLDRRNAAGGKLFDLFIGSVHHLYTIPIDFSKEMFVKARELAGSDDEDALFAAYFDAQLDMLNALHPPIVGHFDLIRLLSDEPDKDLRHRGCDVWPRVVRNLKLARQVGSVLEINTSAWRKGLAHPYPRIEVLQEWTASGGAVVLSDDSHAVGHIGTNYHRLLDYFSTAQVKEVGYFTKKGSDGVRLAKVTVEELKGHMYWANSRKKP